MSRSSLALSNLRAIVIVIVVAFHASLAYIAWLPATTAPFDQPPYQWQAFPIVDAERWIGFDLFCGWHDVSLMSLMFFLAGLLTAPSLLRKGSRTYIADRLWRIGSPFVLAVAFLSPVAHYPAYSVRTLDPSLAGFWRQWSTLPFWPDGPQWFLWQLLALSMVAAALYAVAPRFVDELGRCGTWMCGRPVAFYVILVALSGLAYVPLALAYSPWNWAAVGPFSFQLSRPAHYLVYFLSGAALGRYGLGRGLLAGDGTLARRWTWWLAASIATFLCWAGLTALTMPDWFAAPLPARLGAAIAFPFACAAGVLALLAICLRFAGKRIPALDSLSANAYGIYLTHYLFVVWLQFALLNSGLPAIAKAAIVFSGALAMSWASCLAFERFMLNAHPDPAKEAPSAAPR